MLKFLCDMLGAVGVFSTSVAILVNIIFYIRDKSGAGVNNTNPIPIRPAGVRATNIETGGFNNTIPIIIPIKITGIDIESDIVTFSLSKLN